MIEFTNKHAATDEKTWRIDVKIQETDGETYIHSNVRVVASEDVTIGGILDFICDYYENELIKPEPKIIAYEVIAIRQVKICACCQREIPLTDTYCDEHKAVVKHIMGEWDKLVDSI